MKCLARRYCNAARAGGVCGPLCLRCSEIETLVIFWTDVFSRKAHPKDAAFASGVLQQFVPVAQAAAIAERIMTPGRALDDVDTEWLRIVVKAIR